MASAAARLLRAYAAQVEALRRLRGGALGIIGPSGAGKTSLVRTPRRQLQQPASAGPQELGKFLDLGGQPSMLLRHGRL
jgi:ABC-type glutathione transport system ATPase component